MLKIYITCNLTVRFSKYKLYNKLLGSVILFRVIPSVTWIQLIYVYREREQIKGGGGGWGVTPFSFHDIPRQKSWIEEMSIIHSWLLKSGYLTTLWATKFASHYMYNLYNVSFISSMVIWNPCIVNEIDNRLKVQYYLSFGRHYHIYFLFILTLTHKYESLQVFS